MLIVIATFLVVLGMSFGTYWVLVLRPEGEAERTLDRRLNPNRTMRYEGTASLVDAVTPLSTVPGLDRILTACTGIVRPLERLAEQSGLRVTVGHIVLGSTFGAALAAVAAQQLTGRFTMALAAALLLGSAPYAVMRHLAGRRLARFEEQFPEAVDLIARALRAGHTLATGLAMVVDELPDPVSSEFRLLRDRQNFGMPLPDALRSFGERVPLLDARFFVTAVLTQREAGGNLAEVLDSLSALIRDRFRIKRHVRVLSAHGRITALVLGLLPFVLAALMFVIAPEHITKLFTDPLGIQMVVGAVVLQVVGLFIMRRITHIQI